LQSATKAACKNLAANASCHQRCWSNVNSGLKTEAEESWSVLGGEFTSSVPPQCAAATNSQNGENGRCSGSAVENGILDGELPPMMPNGTRKEEKAMPSPPAFYGRPMTLTDLGKSIEDILKTCPPFTLNGGIKELPSHVFWSIRSLMNSYNFSDWHDYKLWMEGRYSRSLLYSTPRFDMLLLCWPPGAESPVHAHAGSECFVRVLDGQITEWTYEFPSEEALFGDDPAGYGLKLTSCHTVGPETMCYINDQVGVHKIKGSHPERGACTLHIYVPGYKRAVVFKDEENVWKGKMISNVTFDATWDLSSTPSAARI